MDTEVVPEFLMTAVTIAVSPGIRTPGSMVRLVTEICPVTEAAAGATAPAHNKVRTSAPIRKE